MKHDNEFQAFAHQQSPQRPRICFSSRILLLKTLPLLSALSLPITSSFRPRPLGEPQAALPYPFPYYILLRFPIPLASKASTASKMAYCPGSAGCGICALRRDVRNAVPETMVTAMQPSERCQNESHVMSMAPVEARMPHRRVRAATIIITERQKETPMTSFWRRLIWTRQRRRMGITITGVGRISLCEESWSRPQPVGESAVECGIGVVRRTQYLVVMSNVIVVANTPRALGRPAPAQHCAA